MTELETYYYVWKDKAWVCFASGLRGKVLDEPPPQFHPLLGREQEEEPAIKGYRTQTKVVDTFRFLRVKKTKLFTYRSVIDLEAVIPKFFQRLARWRDGLLSFVVASGKFYSILDIVAACKELTDSDRLLIGLYNKYNRSLVFELPEKQNDDYDDRLVIISENENPNTYRELASKEQGH